MMPAIRRVNVDFTAPMLQELDQAASELNVSRHAVIKTLVRQALDQYHSARKSRRAGCRDFARAETFPAASLILDVDPQTLI